jgi:glyoxylase-like metal-dependent hydrolase (beta-lactamase superfamily II)
MIRILKHRLLYVLIALACAEASAEAPSAPAPSALDYRVIRTSDHSFAANMVLLLGEKKAMLIDAPYTRADAHRVVAAILESGRELETIYVTHDHPDHYYSAEVIRQAFPTAHYVSHPMVVSAIWRSLPFKQKRWSALLGMNGPQMPSAPAPLEGDTLTLEGHEIKIIGPMQGDHAVNTAVWVPKMRALFPSDMVHNQVVLWFVEHDADQIAAYRKSLDSLAALNPLVVVPGHEREGLPHDASALEFTRAYLDAWPKLVQQAKNSAELVQLVKGAFPDAVDPNGDFSLVTSASVSMGEEAKWDE